MGRKSREKKERRALAQQMAAAEAWARKHLCGQTNSITRKRCMEPAAFEILTTGHSPVLGEGEKKGEMKVEPSLVRACVEHAKQMKKIGMVTTSRALDGTDFEAARDKLRRKLLGGIVPTGGDLTGDVETASKPVEALSPPVEKS
jgi:hypothetical protein